MYYKRITNIGSMQVNEYLALSNRFIIRITTNDINKESNISITEGKISSLKTYLEEHNFKEIEDIKYLETLIPINDILMENIS